MVGALSIDRRAAGIVVVGDASESTNVISFLGLKFAPGLKIGARILGTNRLFGIIGRANVAVAAGSAAYDVTGIVVCTASDEKN